jgi:N-acetylglucosamine-6-sulfatase
MARVPPTHPIRSTAASQTPPLPSPSLRDHILQNPQVRPNIIMILVDDMESGEAVYMPHLQSLLAQQGATFQNYFVNVSLCCPSRASILRGQYAHNTHILTNLPPSGGFKSFQAQGLEFSTAPVWLQSAGYRTALFGKYLNGYPPVEDPTYIPPGWDEWYSPSSGDPYTEYNYSLNENGKLVDYGSSRLDYGTDVFARLAIDFVTRSARSSQPFFAYIAPYAPHGPSTPARRHASLFNGRLARRDPSFNEADVREKPEYIRSQPRLTQAEITRIDKLFRKRLRSLQAVDEMIAELVDALGTTGVLNKTYLFFSSDNGFLLGQHRLRPEKMVPYEESIRVPLILRGPGIPAGIQIAQLAGNIDLAPTWAELAGTRAPGFTDGRSLVPLWRQPVSTIGAWRQAFLIENGQMDGMGVQELSVNRTSVSSPSRGVLEPPDLRKPTPQDDDQDLPSYRALRLSNGWVYIEYATGERELYNLNTDPFQLQNLAASSDPARLFRLSSWLNDLSGCVSSTCRLIEDRPMD